MREEEEAVEEGVGSVARGAAERERDPSTRSSLPKKTSLPFLLWMEVGGTGQNMLQRLPGGVWTLTDVTSRIILFDLGHLI